MAVPVIGPFMVIVALASNNVDTGGVPQIAMAAAALAVWSPLWILCVGVLLQAAWEKIRR